MKKIDRLARNTLVGIIALGLALVASPSRAEMIAQVVQVVKVEGSAQYSTDGRTWQTLHQGDVLNPGAVIRTAERSLVDVMLGEEGSAGGSFTGPNLTSIPGGAGSGGAGAGAGGGGGSEEEKANIVRIFQSTVLAVDKLTLERTGVDEVSETQLDLRAGQIMANVKKLSKDSRYEIKVPNGVAGIKGSVPLISSSLKCAMLYGSMIVAKAASDGTVKSFEVGPKQKFDPSSDLVSDLSDSEFDQYRKIYEDMKPEQGPGPSTVYKDRTCKNPSPVDGTPVKQ